MAPDGLQATLSSTKEPEVKVEDAKAETESESDSESLHLAPEVKARRPVSPEGKPKAAPAVGQKRSPEAYTAHGF